MVQNQGTIVEKDTMTVLERNIYGGPVLVMDIFGNLSATAYGVFGEAQASATSLGSFSTSTKAWCADVTDIVGCPAGGSVVMTTTNITGAIGKKYTDIMGREIRSQTLNFNGNWTTVDTFYDQLGRTIIQSEPFTILASTGNMGSTDYYYTTTDYDEMDRVLTIISPQHCQEDLGDKDRSCIFEDVITTTTYLGLSVATTNPQLQTTTQYFDETGKVIQSKDADAISVFYQYDASGNLITTSGPLATITMDYDALGRKTSMVDPDKGTWNYLYNALGQQRHKSNTNSQQTTLYDVRGRKFFVNDHSELSIWDYDKAGYGLLSKEYSLRGYDQLSPDVIKQSKQFGYDSYGRPDETITTIYDGEITDAFKSYTTSITYDEFGRAFQSFDATGNGVLVQYNNYGFQYITRDAANGLNGQIYHQIIGTDSRGNVVNEKLNDRFNSYKSYQPETGFLKTIQTISSSGMVQDLSYAFDSIGNLIRRTDHTVRNTSDNDNITETFKYDDLNRLTDEFMDYQTNPEAHYAYDSSGNLTQKANIALSYNKTGNAGPHAVTSTDSGMTYFYDTIGNVVLRNLNGTQDATFTYTSFDKPHTITANGWRAEIVYGANRSRFIRKDIKPGTSERKVTHYLGSVEYIYEAGQPTKAKRYIGNLVINIENDNTSRNSWDYNFLLKDHIGSTQTIVNQFGNSINRMSFNAWGQRRKAPTQNDIDNYMVVPIGQVWTELGQGIEDTTNRGFTGHEHFDQVGIIHMNGRIYDPTIGRFLQADPIIQDPYNTQSLNRYSYVMNNPLSYTDPTGYARLRDGWFRQVVAIAVMFVPGAQGIGMVFLQGMLSGAIATGNLKGAVKGGLQAAVTFGIAHGGAGGTGWIKAGKGFNYARTAAHAVVGGISAEVDGGKFGHGFASALLSQSIGKGKIFDHNKVGKVAIVSNALLQGTISEVTGGKFANGAMSAAFRVAFNEFGGKFERLNDAFADQRKGPIEGDHFYSLSTDVCATSDQFCGTSLIGALSDSESVPFEDHRVGRIDILGVDPIRHSHGVNNDGSVWMLNVALDGHRFGGQVLHTVREINGHVNLTTVGSGFGPFPRENEVLGSALFLKMHFNVLRRYGEARQLMQKRQRSK